MPLFISMALYVAIPYLQLVATRRGISRSLGCDGSLKYGLGKVGPQIACSLNISLIFFDNFMILPGVTVAQGPAPGGNSLVLHDRRPCRTDGFKLSWNGSPYKFMPGGPALVFTMVQVIISIPRTVQIMMGEIQEAVASWRVHILAEST